jgi:hypothetical protein
MAAMATAIAAVEGTDNNQSKGAAEEMKASATVTVAETMMATEMAMVTATIICQHQCQQQRIGKSNDDNTPGMCLAAREHKKKNWTKINYTAQPPTAMPIVYLFCCRCCSLLFHCRGAHSSHHQHCRRCHHCKAHHGRVILVAVVDALLLVYTSSWLLSL